MNNEEEKLLLHPRLRLHGNFTNCTKEKEIKNKKRNRNKKKNKKKKERIKKRKKVCISHSRIKSSYSKTTNEIKTEIKV